MEIIKIAIDKQFIVEISNISNIGTPFCHPVLAELSQNLEGSPANANRVKVVWRFLSHKSYIKRFSRQPGVIHESSARPIQASTTK